MNPLPKLNPSELKSQLYHSLQQKGVLDAMKVNILKMARSSNMDKVLITVAVTE